MEQAKTKKQDTILQKTTLDFIYIDNSIGGETHYRGSTNRNFRIIHRDYNTWKQKQR